VRKGSDDQACKHRGKKIKKKKGPEYDRERGMADDMMFETIPFHDRKGIDSCMA